VSRRTGLPKPDPVPLFLRLCASKGIPVPVREHRFALPEREWRFDLAWPDAKVALEIEGGVHTGGRHTRGQGFENDIEKYNDAVVRGWRVARVVPKNLMSPRTFIMLRAMLLVAGVCR
jgi:hypothetical protein